MKCDFSDLMLANVDLGIAFNIMFSEAFPQNRRENFFESLLLCNISATAAEF